MANENLDGLRRVEALIDEIRATAEKALSVAISGSLDGTTGFVLPISSGGTGESTKKFVDTFSDQFEIDGLKIFRSSVGFQIPSDVVDSGELAGNVRLISCDVPGADVGPQLRFSGKSSSLSDEVFAFGTVAGRKEKGEDGSRAGYLQFATTMDLPATGGTVGGTGSDFAIVEHMRIDSEGTVGIGTAVPVKGLGNRLQVSGGDVLLDMAGGLLSYKLELGDVLGRVQAAKGLFGPDSEHTLLSAGVSFGLGTGGTSDCSLDSSTSRGSAVVDVVSDASATGSGGFVRFLTGAVGVCPSVRGFFSSSGLDVLGEALVSRSVVAGGLKNAVGGEGNGLLDDDGFVTGDNVKFGPGSPEGVVRGRIGAVYGRSSGDPSGSDPPDENTTLWIKVFNDGEKTGWLPVAVGGDFTFCAQADCPVVATGTSGTATASDCRVWFDTARKMLFYFDPDVVRAVDASTTGSWVSVDTFQQTVPVSGRSHAQQFRRNLDKDYEYITPLHFTRQGANVLIVDLTAALRVSRNSNNPDFALNNYYTFDLMTLRRRQGDPSANRATRQEWPGDREAFESKRDNLRGDGHTLHPTLRDELVVLSSTTPSGPPVDGTGSVSTASSSRRVLIDTTKTWTNGQWKERQNDDNGSFPANNGFRVTLLTGDLAGQSRTIRDNTSDTLILRRPWRAVTLSGGTKVRTPSPGDLYEILDSQQRKIIARISTKGNVWPDGAHVDPTGDRSADPPPLFPEYAEDDEGNLLTRSQVVRNGQFLTRDVQDFVTSVKNGLSANNPGGADSPGSQMLDPDARHLDLDLYVDLEGLDGEATDAVLLAGLWDSVRRPGRLSGVVSVTYRLALPPDCGGT